MGQNNGRSGVHFTCPDIDKCKGILQRVAKELFAISKHTEDEDLASDLRYYASDLDDAGGILEDLRKNNTDLRQFGDEKCDELEETENEWAKESRMLEQKLSDANDEIAYLKREIEDLKSELQTA